MKMTASERRAKARELTAETEKLEAAIRDVQRLVDSYLEADEHASMRTEQARHDLQQAEKDWQTVDDRLAVAQEQLAMLKAELQRVNDEAAELLKLEPADLDGTAVDEPLFPMEGDTEEEDSEE